MDLETENSRKRPKWAAGQLTQHNLGGILTKVTKHQREFLGRLEFALANMTFDGMIDREKMKWAEALGPVVELLQQGEPILAVFEGERTGISEEVLDTIRKEFKLCKW